MKDVALLDLIKNAINKIESYCFNNKPDLKVVKLNNNALEYIEKFGFYNSTSLLYIDLSNNRLTILLKHLIVLSDKLLFISLGNNTLDPKTSADSLNHLNVKFIRIDNFAFCCLSGGNAKCSAKRPWYASCFHLLVNNAIKYTFWVMSFAIIVANLLHLCLKTKQKQDSQKRQAFNIIISSISCSNIMGSVPLFILWISDLYFKHYLVFVEDQWKSNVMCFVSCGINMHCSLTSPFLSSLLSYARYDVVKNPMHSKFKRSDCIFKIVLLGCIFILFFSFFITVFHWLNNHRMPTVICTSYFDPSRKSPLAKQLAWFLISVLVIAVPFNLIINLNLIAEIS